MSEHQAGGPPTGGGSGPGTGSPPSRPYRSGPGGRGGPGGRRGGRFGGRRRFLFRRRKYCKFCEAKAKYIDHKDLKILQNYTPERAKILPRRISGTCARHQRLLMRAIKRARILALLPFSGD
jgi:small subunit ribosomal protein S18